MEIIDKEQIFNNWVHQGTIEEINAFNKKLCSERVEIAYKQGFEYAENHYTSQLGKIESELALKTYEYGCLLEISEIYKTNWENSNKELQKTKELLKRSNIWLEDIKEQRCINLQEEIREFLNKNT